MAVKSIKEIEEHMEEIRMIMKIWIKFYKILTTTFFSEDADISKLDPEFQQIKQVVAEHHAQFMQVIKKDFHIGQSVLTTVKRTITLEGFSDLSQLEVNKTLIEWHDANILLNETLGSLEAENDRHMRGRRKTSSLHKTSGEKAKEFFQSGSVKILINFALIVVIAIVIYVLWEPISESSIYKNYLKWMVDWVLNLVGMAPTEEVTPS